MGKCQIGSLALRRPRGWTQDCGEGPAKGAPGSPEAPHPGSPPGPGQPGPGKTGCRPRTEPAPHQEEELISLSRSLPPGFLYPCFPNHPGIFLAPWRTTRAKDTSQATFPWPGEPHATLVFGPGSGGGGTLARTEPSPTVSGGERASKTGRRLAFFLHCPLALAW